MTNQPHSLFFRVDQGVGLPLFVAMRGAGKMHLSWKRLSQHKFHPLTAGDKDVGSSLASVNCGAYRWTG